MLQSVAKSLKSVRKVGTDVRAVVIEQRETLKQKANSLGMKFDIFEFDRLVYRYGLTPVVAHTNKVFDKYKQVTNKRVMPAGGGHGSLQEAEAT